MGRRIPKSRRHKKLKSVDPFRKDGNPQADKINKRANLPPPTSEQEVPYNLQHLFDRPVKKNRNKFKKNKNLIQVTSGMGMVKEVEPGMSRPVKSLPEVVQQRKYESESQFIRRLEHMAGRAIVEAKMEDKYDINVLDDGKRIHVEREPPSEKKREKRKAHDQKRKEKKMKKRKHNEDWEEFHDKVEFGETVHRPPEFQLSSKAKQGINERKPGAKGLLLKNMLSGQQVPENSSLSRKVDFTVKRKELTPGDRRRLEEERERVVQLYRKMKEKKNKVVL